MSQWREENGLVVRTEMFDSEGVLRYLARLKNISFKAEPDRKFQPTKFTRIEKLDIKKDGLDSFDELEEVGNRLLASICAR